MFSKFTYMKSLNHKSTKKAKKKFWLLQIISLIFVGGITLISSNWMPNRFENRLSDDDQLKLTAYEELIPKIGYLDSLSNSIIEIKNLMAQKSKAKTSDSISEINKSLTLERNTLDSLQEAVLLTEVSKNDLNNSLNNIGTHLDALRIEIISLHAHREQLEKQLSSLNLSPEIANLINDLNECQTSMSDLRDMANNQVEGIQEEITGIAKDFYNDRDKPKGDLRGRDKESIDESLQKVQNILKGLREKLSN